MAVTDVLPSSLARERRGIVMHLGRPFIPLFCANCGADGGLVDQAGVDAMADHFYLCEPCGAKWGELAGATLISDEVFWAKVRDAQLEKFGRLLTIEEQVEALKDGNHILSKLARERTASK